VRVDFSGWDTAVGMVTYVNHGKGAGGEMEYFINGKQYNGGGRVSCGNHLGEKYLVKVNPADPTDYMPLSWLPVFDDNERTYEAEGEIVRIYKFRFLSKALSGYAIEYVYEIQGIGYKAIQDLPPDYEEGRLKVGQHYKVQFGAGNPQRSVMHLDMPVSI